MHGKLILYMRFRLRRGRQVASNGGLIQPWADRYKLRLGAPIGDMTRTTCLRHDRRSRREML